MSHTAFFINLLLVHCTTQSLVKIPAKCGEAVSLPCHEDIERLDFMSVVWYKLNSQRVKKGLIRKKKLENKTHSYSHHTLDFGDKYSLVLPSVTPNDSGTYDCSINANVGGKNLNYEVQLVVEECVTPTTCPTPPNTQPEDLPVLWSILGYVSVGLVKILLSLISILGKYSGHNTDFCTNMGQIRKVLNWNPEEHHNKQVQKRENV